MNLFSLQQVVDKVNLLVFGELEGKAIIKIIVDGGRLEKVATTSIERGKFYCRHVLPIEGIFPNQVW